MSERLQKILSQAGIASRRAAEKLILDGRVAVNGKIVTELGAKVEWPRDRVTVDGKPITAEKLVYILLNKPKGVITSLKDPRGRKTVIDLLRDVPERVYPVGRLDYNTEGLLLLTNDGLLTHALTHPSHEIKKTYVAKIAGLPTEEQLDRLRVGIKLSDGMTAPAAIRLLNFDPLKQEATVEIIIHEGRNRQVRRMFEAIGHPVKNLKRTKYAFLTLTGLKRGEYRYLTPDEVAALKKLAQG
ncbi:pseudouridine synthase [Sporolituus thermophilus]|uniref:Pseudouridine synthase n=1 Tax=Sporolituus thermophilus DSM 23256 TaxID=1123285 RepID=A0A1G7JLG4_9FIRM|nr:pseudouridine synthase [Sporolituus thermophilus]SDF25782.1 23S rRNA pseudouridine2605 synthase [Sporolituus thermophilus DSM 23256]